MQVVGRQVGHRGGRGRVLDGQHKGGWAAIVGVLRCYQVAPRRGQRRGVDGACGDAAHRQVAVVQGNGVPRGRHRRGGAQRAGVTEAQLLLARDGELRLHRHRQRLRLVGTAVEEITAIVDFYRVDACLIKYQSCLVCICHHICVHPCGGCDRPSVLRRAEEGQTVEHRIALAHIGLALDGEARVYDGYLAAHQHGTGLVAEGAVEAEDAVAVVRTVPLHGGRGCALTADKGASVHIPIVVAACGGAGRVGHRVALAHRAVALDVQRRAIPHLYQECLLVVAAAVVVDAVGHHVAVGVVVEGESGCAGGSPPCGLPEVACNVGPRGVGVVDKLNGFPFADPDYFVTCGVYRIGRHCGSHRCGGVDQFHLHRIGTGGAVGQGRCHHQQAPFAIVPGDGQLVTRGAVRHIARHRPGVGDRLGDKVEVRRIGHRRVFARHHQLGVLIGRSQILVVIDALRVEAACHSNVALRMDSAKKEQCHQQK